MESIPFDQLARIITALPQRQLKQLLNRIASALSPGGKPSASRDLYGVWKGRFPKGFDVDAALGEIRGQWNRDGSA